MTFARELLAFQQFCLSNQTISVGLHFHVTVFAPIALRGGGGWNDDVGWESKLRLGNLTSLAQDSEAAAEEKEEKQLQ
jgi:hypothetical protein